MSIPLQKLKTSTIKKSATLTNIGKGPPDPHVRQSKTQSSRNFDSNRDNDILNTFFKNEYPPYNPADFDPEKAKSVKSDELNSQVINKHVSKVNYNQELLKKIRQELNEWMAESENNEKRLCTEQWTTLPLECMYLFVSVPPFYVIVVKCTSTPFY